MSEPMGDREAARYEAMHVLADAKAWPEAAKELVRVLGETLRWDAVALWIVHEPSRTIRCDAFWARPGGGDGDFEAVSSRTFFSRGECLPGRVWNTGAGQWVRDISRDMGFLRGREASAAGLISVCAVPIRENDDVLGAIELFSLEGREDDPSLRDLLEDIGARIGRLRRRMWVEVSLNESQALYRDLFWSIQDAVVVTDIDRCLLDANAAFTEIFGYTVEELRGRSIRPVYQSEADYRSVGRILPRGKNARPAMRALRLRRKSGETFEAEMNIFPLLGSRTGGCVSIIRDLTETRRTEKALVRSEERFSRIFRSSPAAIGMGSVEDGRIYDVNDRYLDFFGYTREEMIGRTIGELGLWAEPEQRIPLIERLRRDGEVRSIEARFRTKNGEIRVGLLSMVVVTIDDEDVLVAMLDDITERKRSEDALGRTNAQLSLLIESLPVVVYTARADGDYATTWVSSNAATVMGHPPEAFTSSPSFWRERLHPEDAARLLPALTRVSETGRMDFEYRWRVDETTYLWFHDVVRLVEAPDGVCYRLGVAYDVTARRVAEEERAELLLAERTARGEVEATLSRLSAIQSVTDTALALLSLDDLLRETLARVRGLLHADMSAVFLLDAEEGCLRMRAGDGLDVARADGVGVPLGQGIVGRIASSGAPMVVEDLTTVDAISPFLQEAARSLLGVPLVVEGQVVGVMCFGSRARRQFLHENVELLQMVADRVAPAIDRAHLFDEVKAGREHLQRLSRRLVELQEAERSQIARELHDEIGQLLTGLKLLLESEQASISPPSRSDASPSLGALAPSRSGAPESRFSRFLRQARQPAAPEGPDPRQEIHSIVDDLLGRVRNLSMDLRPAMLDQLGLTPALLWHVERYQTQTGIRVAFHHSGVDRRFSPDMEISAFRIVQEALTNVARHSGSRAATVEVRADGERLMITVADDGKGFDPEAAQEETASSGLAGMRERARSLGGRVRIVSSAREGTALVAELPIGFQQLAAEEERR